MNLSEIVSTIKRNDKQHKPVLIAIEGFGGSGKTTLAQQLKNALQDAYIINIDDFIIKAKLTEPSWDKGAFDRERLEQQVLIPATTGKDVAYQKLIWVTDTLSEPVTVPKVAHLIVEGISSYHPNIAKYYDYKIWVDTPIELAKERGHARDGSNENAQHWDLWAENDLAYQQKHHPERQADFVISNNDDQFNLGLRRGMVSVIAYQPYWKDEFEAERQCLLKSLGGYISEIEHVGSTSIPELAAKPIIDMIAAVNDLSVYKQLIEPLTALGYEYMPERVFDDRVFFPKGSRENRTHHLSLVIKGSKGWTEPILFRDYLISNNKARAKYQKLKLSLAEKYPDDRASYTKAKEQLIEQILAEAQKTLGEMTPTN